ncbi:Cytochrome c lysine N-methyltransferase 1 [Nakaseomyces bracarensis]|uniref:Cytochrome c lysine N-methyltransferase 1 n=1 Tax=Nakaseomyces bracarensis TaxID=273131 RepID=A0ABR4NUB2_9SACH
MLVDGVEVLEDDYGGYGVFIAEPRLLQERCKSRAGDRAVKEGRLEVLRVSQVYDIKRLLAMMDSEGTNGKFFKTIINVSLEQLSQLSETCILVFFVLVIHLMDIEGYNVPKDFSEYISTVLVKTTVGNASNCVDSLLESYGHVILFHDLENNLEILHDTATRNIPFTKHYSKKLLTQLYSAIVSRVLEIPQITDGDNGDDSFEVTPSLVPMLDYVNHGDERKRNAFYDVDRATGDIVLYLDLTRIDLQKVSSKNEILISYTDVEDSMGIITKYGFDPANDLGSTATKIFSCPFYKKYLETKPNTQGLNVRNFYRWLCVLPTIQFLRDPEGHWLINNALDEFMRLLLPFVCDPGTGEGYWEYSDSPEVKERFMEYFEEYDPLDERITYDMVRQQFKWYESSNNDFMPFPPCVWSIKQNFTSGKSISVMEQEDYVITILKENNDIYNSTIRSFESYLKEYIKNRKVALHSLTTSKDSALSQIANRELKTLSAILIRMESGKSIYINSDEPEYKLLPVVPSRNIEEPPEYA